MLFLTPINSVKALKAERQRSYLRSTEPARKRLTPILLATLAGDPLSTPICPLDSAHWTPPIVISHVFRRGPAPPLSEL